MAAHVQAAQGTLQARLAVPRPPASHVGLSLGPARGANPGMLPGRVNVLSPQVQARLSTATRVLQKSTSNASKLIEGAWDGVKTIRLPAGTRFNHANPSGTDGGSGQSGKKGNAIWLTSINDTNASWGYSMGSKVALIYEAKKDLVLAHLNMHEQIFGDEVAAWQENFPHLDGTYTPHGSTYEVVVFDKSNLELKETQELK